jgi:hypothetical protein
MVPLIPEIDLISVKILFYLGLQIYVD